MAMLGLVHSTYWFLLVGTAIIAFLHPVQADSNVDGLGANSFPYLYATRKDLNASFPVIEYIAPTSKRELDNDQPAFLYDKKQGYRIVVFYGHWCGTCKALKAHYVHFAQRVQQIAKRQNETVSVYAVSCHPNRKLCRKQTSLGFPVVRLLPPHSLDGIDIKHTDINPMTCLQKMGMKFESAENDDKWDIADPLDNSQPTQWQSMFGSIFGGNAANTSSSSVQTHRRRSREEMKNDIYLSFDFAMRDGVFTADAPLSDKAAKALKDWLRLLQKTLPATWEIQTLLGQLLRDHNYITKHEAYMVSILDQYAPPKPVWSEACSKGDPDAGYTCGLWEMFHAMTVGLVDYNAMNHEEKRVSPDEAAHVLRDYIENFFGCMECRNNFLAMYDSCAHDRCNRLQTDAKGLVQEKQASWAQLALWLFEAHNGVNVRLVRERAEREKRTASKQEELNALWPSKRECAPCYAKSSSSKTTTNNKGDVVEWDKTNVFKWLLIEYGARDTSTADLRKELQALAVASAKEEQEKRTRVQITSSSALIALAVLAFLGRKVHRRNVTGRHKKNDKRDNASVGSVGAQDSLSIQDSPVKKRGTIGSSGKTGGMLDRLSRQV